MKVIYPVGDGVAVICPTGALRIEEVARKDVPAGVPYLIVEDDAVPADRTFRSAWEADFSAPHGYGIGAAAWFAEQAQGGCAVIRINMGRAREIGHEMRRARRAAEFAPHDEVIAKRIPGAAEADAEAARQAIRDRYAVVQDQIDAATTPAAVKAALGLPVA